MATSTNRLFSALVLVLAWAPAACSSFGSDPAATGASENVPEPERQDAGDASPPKAPIVTGTPDASEFNENFGVFVAPSGIAGAAGTRKQPLASIQAGIDLGKSLGKRVYVCGGTFRESLVTARNGAEELAALRAGPAPCVVLLDLMMPVMDGWILRAEMLADPALAQIPVVVVSGAADLESKTSQLKAARVLTKPVKWPVLLDSVRVYC